MTCHQCKVHEATINGLRETVRTQGEIIQKIKAVIRNPWPTTDTLSPRGIKRAVNGFDKD